MAAGKEIGRFRFEELACVRCHKPAVDDRPGPKFPDDGGLSLMAKGLADRAGPNLTEVAKRDHAGWIDAWLADPAKLRPHTAMPKMFADTDAGRAERYAIVRYLVAFAGNNPPEPVKPPTLSNEYRQSMERGRVLFTVTGCAACHQDPLPKKAARNDEDEKEALQPEDYFYAAGSPGPATKYNLGALGSKYRPETLAAYLQSFAMFAAAGIPAREFLTRAAPGADMAVILPAAARAVDEGEYPGELANVLMMGAT